MNGRWGGTGRGEEDGEKSSESEVKNTFQKVLPKHFGGRFRKDAGSGGKCHPAYSSKHN